ncbi:hypothetical protein ACFX11_037025 [Malus domestica]
MEDDAVNTAAIICIRLKQPRSKLRVPELRCNFSAVAWCGKLNAIACASETCANIPSSNANVPFGIPIHIVIPERPTERAVFNVNADSPRDSVQFIEWSPPSCPRALLIANFQGRVTIWTQPSQGPANLVHDASRWQQEHEWQQGSAVVTKWLPGVSPYKLLSSKSSTSSNGKSTFEEKSLSQQSQNSARWPSFLCVCSVLHSGSVKLHWSQYPPNQTGAAPKWFQTSMEPFLTSHVIIAADAIITDSGAMHVACVPVRHRSRVTVWEVKPGLRNGFHTTPRISTTHGVPPSINPPNLAGVSPLAAYLFSWQDYLLSEAKQGRKKTAPLHCSLVSEFSAFVSPEVSNFSAFVSPKAESQFGVNAVAFDPIRGGSVIAVVIVEGRYMSPYDRDEGVSITGWRVQRWESSLQPVVLHQIVRNPISCFGGQAPMQTVWLSKVDTSIQQTNDFKSHQYYSGTFARIVYSAHGGEIAVAFLRGGVHIFSGSNFAPVDNYQINVGSAIAAPAFSSTSCCSASVWHDRVKDRTVLKILRVLPPAVPSSQVKANSSTWEWAIAKRFWWSLLVGLDWWDVVSCTQSAAEDGIVSLNSVIAVLDASFHSIPSTQHKQRFGPVSF